MDSILSVRINEEVKENFIKLAEEHGVNNKEFLDLIIKNYELNKASADIDFVKNDIDELQGIVKRITDIYINIIDKSKVRTTELINNFNSSISEEKEKSEEAAAQIVALKKDLEQLKKENKELIHNNKELQDQVTKEKEGIKESREMNVILKDKLEDFNNYKKENDTLKNNNGCLQNKLKDLEDKYKAIEQSLEKYIDENEVVKTRYTEIEEKSIVKIEEERVKYQEQLKLKENHLSLKLQQEFLQKEQNLRQEIWITKEKYDEKISNLMKEKEELIHKISIIQNK